MAVLIAEYLLAFGQKGAQFSGFVAIIFASLGLLLTLVFVVVRLGLVPDSVFGSGRHAAENVAFMHALEDVALSVPKVAPGSASRSEPLSAHYACDESVRIAGHYYMA